MSTEIKRNQTQAGSRRVGNTAAREKETVQGLRRGFAVIKAFTADAPALSVSQVAARTGFTRAVARRYLLTLEDLGCVVQAGSFFTPTPRLLDLGFTYLATLDVANVSQPAMENVVEKLHESCSIAVLDEHDIVYVARVAAKRIMSINLVTGSRLPAHATSIGKILLAHLPPKKLDAYFATAPLQRLTTHTICDQATLRAALEEARTAGWAVSDQDCEEGVRTIAAPLFDRSTEVVAAINVSAHAARVSMKELRRDYLPVLLEAARDISRTLGARIDAGRMLVRDRSRRPSISG